MGQKKMGGKDDVEAGRTSSARGTWDA